MSKNMTGEREKMARETSLQRVAKWPSGGLGAKPSTSKKGEALGLEEAFFGETASSVHTCMKKTTPHEKKYLKLEHQKICNKQEK